MQKLAYLSLGSNLGDRAANLRRAIELLGTVGEVTAVSDFYETEPMEVSGQPWFLNCAVELRTEKMPRRLISALLKLERHMGRKRSGATQKQPRIIDMDLLLVGDHIISTAELKLPHPAMAQRRFVLVPLEQIAPEVMHPVLKRSIRELSQGLPASSGAVRKYAGEAAKRGEKPA